MKPVRTWILIADARTARIVENAGPGKGVTLVAGRTFQAEREPDFADQPGRTFESATTGRSKLEPHGGADYALDGFAAVLAKEIERDRRARRFDRLVLCAGPQLLGALRQALSKEARAMVSAEIGKTLTHVPEPDLPAHLEGELAI